MAPSITPRSWFECWRKPSVFFCTAWTELKPITSKTPSGYIRDAYVAGLFARIWNYHNKCEVRLIAKRDEFPDAQLRENDNTMNLEIAIVDKPGRRIWAEQREWAEMSKRGEPVLADSPKKRTQDAREAIPIIVKKKVDRYLGNRIERVAPAHLLMYLMQGQTPLVSYPLISDDEMLVLTKPYKDNFKSIWVICGNPLSSALNTSPGL